MKNFIRNLIAGYEPAMLRSIVLAVVVLLGAYGIGTGDLPDWLEQTLIFLGFILPILQGYLIRRKVVPTLKLDPSLPDDPYPEGYDAALNSAHADELPLRDDDPVPPDAP